MKQEKINDLKERILYESEAQKLPCKQAFTIAREIDCSLADVGKTCNELGVKIVGCQLGCF